VGCQPKTLVDPAGPDPSLPLEPDRRVRPAVAEPAHQGHELGSTGIALAVGDRDGLVPADPHLGTREHPDVGVQHALCPAGPDLPVGVGQQHGGSCEADHEVVHIGLLATSHAWPPCSSCDIGQAERYSLIGHLTL
jgi:hypothetical protein